MHDHLPARRAPDHWGHMVEAGVRHALGAPGAVVLLRMLPTSSRPIEERERTEGVINTRTIPIP